MGKLGKKFIKLVDKLDKQENESDRIDIILTLIKDIWRDHPNLRLCQIIGNCFEAGDLYYKEDDELFRRLVRAYLEEEDES